MFLTKNKLYLLIPVIALLLTTSVQADYYILWDGQDLSEATVTVGETVTVSFGSTDTSVLGPDYYWGTGGSQVNGFPFNDLCDWVGSSTLAAAGPGAYTYEHPSPTEEAMGLVAPNPTQAGIWFTGELELKGEGEVTLDWGHYDSASGAWVSGYDSLVVHIQAPPPPTYDLPGFVEYWLSAPGKSIGDQYDHIDDNWINYQDFSVFALSWGRTEYYVSANNGSDLSPGTEALPFKTIQKAADRMQPGDVCYIRDGIYRETIKPARIGTETKPITFCAYPGENPVISGTDVLNGSWSVHSGSIYKTSIASQEVPFNQLFVDGQMYNKARWPNTGVNQLVTMNRASADSGTNETTLVDDALPAGDWNGATVHITSGAEWLGFTTTISNYNPGTNFTFDDTTWYNGDTYYLPEADDPYWLHGVLAGLDIATEWHLEKINPNNYNCYLWCAGDDTPANHLVEIKKRDHAFDLSNRSYIQVKGLRIFSAAVLMDNSQNCLVEDCHIKYVDHFDQISNVWGDSYGPTYHANRMSGSNNEWKECSIIYSAGTGIFDYGDYNKVTNCIIHDVDYMALYAGGISNIAASTGGLYTYNTIYNSGRFAFWHNGTAFECKYNHMYDVGYLTEDLGVTYTGWTDGLDTTNGKPGIISYNWVHDNHCTIYPKGIYVDENSSNYTVHHNLIWNIPESAIILGGNPNNLNAYNNTILSSCDHAFSGAADETCRVINNLHKPIIGWFATGAYAPELHHNGNYAINPDDSTLTDTSGAIDAGYVIPGITDGYTGSAPDIGCYEYGQPKWTAGADWTEPAW